MQYETLDAELVQGLRKGDDAAAQQLIDAYSTPLYRYLRRRCFCEEDAIDVLSMVFQKVVAAIHTYDAARGSFKNWLYHVAHTCRADFYRGWGTGASAELPCDDLLAAGDELTASCEPWKYLLDECPEDGESPITRAVREVFARMPSRYAEVLQLAHADLTREEVANVLGISRDHLRVLLNRACSRFKQLALQHPILSKWLARAELLGDEKNAPVLGSGPALARA